MKRVLTVSKDFADFSKRHKLFDDDEITPIKKPNKGENLRPPTQLERLLFVRLDYLVRKKRISIASASRVDIDSFFPGLEKEKSNYLLALWRKNHNEEGNYKLIVLP